MIRRHFPAGKKHEGTAPVSTTIGLNGPEAPRFRRMTKYADEYEIMAAIKSRDTAGVRALYNRFSRAVFSVCVRVLRDRLEAEEVLLDVFMEIWQKPERYDPLRSKPSTFVLLLARSRAIDRRRKIDRQPAVSTDELPDVAAPTEGSDGEDVNSAIGTLKRSQQEVIRLSFFGGRSHSEIATELGIPIGTVKTRIRTAIRQLRSQLSHDRT